MAGEQHYLVKRIRELEDGLRQIQKWTEWGRIPEAEARGRVHELATKLLDPDEVAAGLEERAKKR